MYQTFSGRAVLLLRLLALLVCATLLFASPTDVVRQADASGHVFHRNLNSQWNNFRSGPVLARTAVPSLVDADGYFVSARPGGRRVPA